MDDEQLMELLTQIQDLAGVALDSLAGAQGAPPESEPKPQPDDQGPPA